MTRIECVIITIILEIRIVRTDLIITCLFFAFKNSIMTIERENYCDENKNFLVELRELIEKEIKESKSDKDIYYINFIKYVLLKYSRRRWFKLKREFSFIDLV